MTIKFSDITGGGIPYGNNAGRPANPGIGKLYSNGEAQRLELYTDTGWNNIVQEVPGVSSISGNYSEQTDSGTFVIYGTNFTSGAYATAIGSNGVQINASSTVFNSLVQLTATFTGLSNQYEPYDIKVTNPSNLFGLIPDALYINASPVWVTSAGSLGTFAEQVSVTLSALSATDLDSTITYSVASGSSLPTGITLNSSTGLLSGTLPDVVANTTYTFTINASDGLNIIPRTFSVISNAAPTWSTPAGSLGTILERDLVAFQFSATDPTTTSLVYSSSNIPNGLTLSSEGILSGVAPNVDSNTTFNFDINVTDGINTVSRSFSLNVNALTSVELLLVGGGGGGGGTISGHHESAGGGGAGGLYYNATMPITGSHLVTVGAGGAGGTSAGTTGYTGENSVFGTKIALGGGGGGGQYANPSNNGIDGGSGGGWCGHAGFGRAATNTGLQSTSETGGLGNAGGQSTAGGPYGGGGGGGAGSGGSNGSNSSGSYSGGGQGGAGAQYSITGTNQYYAAGGGGAAQQNGSGGSGGSGIGGNGSPGSGSAGSTNTGSGGGGGGAQGGNGGSGGSGVVVFAVPGTHTAANIPGTLTYTRDTTTRSGHTVYRFTAGSGTITL